MTEYKTYKIKISPHQGEKIKSAYKNKAEITIQTEKGTEPIKLTQRQINKIEKNSKEGKGARIRLTYNQLNENYKSGGFLPLVFAGLGALGALLGGGAAVASTAIDAKDKAVQREETKRHHLEEEKIARSKVGSGLTKTVRIKKTLLK